MLYYVGATCQCAMITKRACRSLFYSSFCRDDRIPRRSISLIKIGSNTSFFTTTNCPGYNYVGQPRPYSISKLTRHISLQSRSQRQNCMVYTQEVVAISITRHKKRKPSHIIKAASDTYIESCRDFYHQTQTEAAAYYQGYISSLDTLPKSGQASSQRINNITGH